MWMKTYPIDKYQHTIDSLFDETKTKMAVFRETSLLKLICYVVWKYERNSDWNQINLQDELNICQKECEQEDYSEILKLPQLLEQNEFNNAIELIQRILLKYKISDIRKIERLVPDKSLINKLKEVLLFLGNESRRKSTFYVALTLMEN